MLKAFSPAARSEMLPASRWMPSSRAQPRAAVEARAVERLGAGEQLLAAGEQVPLLRQRDELGAVGRRGAHEPLGGVEVPGLVVGRVELYRGCAQSSFLAPWLTDQSIGDRLSIGGDVGYDCPSAWQ